MARLQKSGNVPDFVPKPYNRGKKRDAYLRGWQHGHGIACHNVPYVSDKINRCVDWAGLGDFVTLDNIAEYHQELCFAAADNSRQYSPFEYTAHEFNTSRNPDSLWEAFEAGTGDAIAADLRTYNYGED